MNSGARLRNLHLATALAERCSVTLFQITQPAEEPASSNTTVFEEVVAVPKGPSYTPANILRGLIGPTPLTVLNYSSDKVAGSLAKILEKGNFDAVQLESSHLFSYLPVIRSARGRPAVLLDWHNIESELMYRFASEAANPAKKIVARRTASLLEKLETTLLESCDFHTVVSERERQKLLLRQPNASVEVIPNGVDVASFSSVNSSPSPSTLLFVGSMDYHANIDAVSWFVREIWPTVAHRLPAMQFKIVGRAPTAAVRALASGRIQVTGTVDDVRPYYAEAASVVVPLRVGGGTRLKILEAMAMGTPVISTRLGAEGIAAADGDEILLADSAADLAAAIERVASEPNLRSRLASSGRKLVAGQYDWSLIGENLYRMHSKLLR